LLGNIDTLHVKCYIIDMAARASGYTVSELEALTGVQRRTIHFYVKEGVIAAPEGSGGGARYGEEHILRLQLTRELQKSHLKLSGIREAMESLSTEEMRAIVQNAGSPTKTWDRQSLEQWLEARVPIASDGPGMNRSTIETGGGPARPRGKGSAPSRGETWERIRVAEGLELLLRSDLAPRYQGLVDEIAARTRRRPSAAEDMDED
jgi:DNA-binding transcriptional MerR regulator